MDFSEKPMVDISSIAGVLQRKAAQQAQMDEQAQQQKMQMIQQAVQGASQTVLTMVQASKDRQKSDFVKSLGDAMAAQVPGIPTTLPQQGPSLPDYNNIQPSAPVPGNVADRTSIMPQGTPGQVGTSQLGLQPLPPVQTSIPDVNKQNAIRAAVNIDPKAAADNLVKSNNPTAANDFYTKIGADGKLHQFSKLDPTYDKTVGGADGFQTNAVTADQRKQQLGIAQENADTRGENANTNQSRFVTVTGNKFADAVDVSKMPDYARLQSAKRLDQFVQANQNGPITKQMMKDASIMLAGMLTGSGKGGAQVAEKLIDDVTPSTLKGTAKDKLQWLTNNPEDVDQGKFLKIMSHTADREANAAEDNLRQHQVEGIKKYGTKLKSLDPKRYQDIIDSTGLTEENIDSQGRFVRTAKVRSLLPNYQDTAKTGVDLGGGFSYTVR